MKIYILKLENGKYYVGKTKNESIRIQSHFDGTSNAVWTTKHKPISIERVIENCDEFDEDKYTKIYMKKYGIDNVRGGTYSGEHIHYTVKYFLEKELDHARDKCFSCGRVGHLSIDCVNNGNSRLKIKMCGNCGSKGHSEKDCYVKKILRPDKICWNCEREGHLGHECFLKKY